MKRRLGFVSFLSLVLVATGSLSAHAAIDFEVTEIWYGQAGSPDLTNDWFELKNTGDLPWLSGVSGLLTVNDDTGGLTTDALIQGIESIYPGESAIVVMEGSAALADAFFNVWDPVLPQRRNKIGFAAGSGLGLGDGGDQVNIWLSDVLLDTKAYSGGGPNAASWDATLSAFSTVGNASGAVATLATAGNPVAAAVGSPHTIPEPGSIVLLALASVGLCIVSRKQ